MLKMPNIVFIAPQLQQPRVIRRIATVYNEGYPIKVYGFDSGIFSENLKSISFPVTEIIKRDKKDSKLKKSLCFIKTLRRIKKENSTEDIFYIFSAEMGNFSWVLRNRKTIYEEADILGAYFKKETLRKLFRWIDRGTIHRSLLTVFTSEGFVDYTFGEDNRPENVLVIPNKLNSRFFNANRKVEVSKSQTDINHLKFGFVGIIRYPNTIIRFAEVIGREFPQHEFHFFGTPDVASYVDKVKMMPNVFLHGPFVNPVELPTIYQQIDIVVSCYDTSSWNVRVAEPNKLYEAVFFERPIVVSKDTFLAKQVERYNAGYSIKANDDQSIIDFVKGIDSNDLARFQDAESKVHWEGLIDDTKPFLERIKQIVRSK
ncbi:MAG: hypothetical protein J5708_01500 [Bacteroidales bacterium]|nr:hypothetical protein [Bacteroidales bacterium]